jgi:hypothetical protein
MNSPKKDWLSMLLVGSALNQVIEALARPVSGRVAPAFLRNGVGTASIKSGKRWQNGVAGMRQGEPTLYLSTAALIIMSVVFSAAISAYFFPGLMSFDSLYQYEQAVGLAPPDSGHPMIMVYLWRLLMKLLPSPGALLVFQQIAYWLSAAYLAWALTERPLLKIVFFLVFGWWAPQAIISLHLWVDPEMNIALTTAVAAIIADARKRSPAHIFIGFASLLYAVVVRYNGIISAFPLVVLLSWRCTDRKRNLTHLSLEPHQVAACAPTPERSANHRAFGQRLVLACLMVGSFLIISAATIAALNYGARKGPGLDIVMVWDIAAIVVDRQKDVFPPYVHTPAARDQVVTAVTKTYNPNAGSLYKMGVRTDPVSTIRLALDWLQLIAEYPSSFLKHRFSLFETLLGVGMSDSNGQSVYYPFHYGVDANPYGISMSNFSTYPWDWIKVFTYLTKFKFYKPWLYFGLEILIIAWMLACAALGRLTEIRVLASVVAFSGFIGTASLFVIAPAADYRYVIWLISSCVISVLLLVIDAIGGRKDKNNEKEHALPRGVASE